jgi:hypothetical protein
MEMEQDAVETTGVPECDTYLKEHFPPIQIVEKKVFLILKGILGCELMM